jgi:hexosaminidase
MYDHPLDLPLPTHLRAAAFTSQLIPGSELDRHIDAFTTRHRFSPELQLCVNDPSIAMEQDPPIGTRPVTLANYHNPCWIYRDANLHNIRGISAEVVRLPYIFSERASNLNLGDAHTQFGELEVHADTCTGPLLATLPIDPSHRDANGLIHMQSAIPAQQGNRDLCFNIVRPQADPLLILNAIQLEPR